MVPGKRLQTTSGRRRHAEAGRGGRADPPERVLPEQRRGRARPGWRAAHRPRGARRRNGLPRERPVRLGPDRGGRLLDAPALGSPALGRQARRGAPLRHRALRGHGPGPAVRPGREGPRRRAAETAGQVPLDLLGLIAGLPAGTAQIPWDGPEVRIVEHQAHAPGHAALLIEERGVLVAGDMLSDVLIPMLDLNAAADPVGDSLAALRLLEGVAGGADVLVPGHGSAGGAGQVRVRIDQDRAYVQALRDGHVPGDPRAGPSAQDGWDWVAGVHARQLQGLARRSARDGTPG